MINVEPINCESNHKIIPPPTILIISLEIVQTGIILLHADPQVVCYVGSFISIYSSLKKELRL